MRTESKTRVAGPPGNPVQQAAYSIQRAAYDKLVSIQPSGDKPKPSVDAWPKTCLSCGALVKSAGSHCCGH